ncbi:sensor histidine kinase [Hugenholtzia roseola]|uniref:sensor histidine kinase n=1 Tax=Hugenholtzia roseola TaxID=1002 RepID=UPI000552BEB4|nr:HAMP domain-containing sensor histidine kinase [Hugenholtzia roseola]
MNLYQNRFHLKIILIIIAFFIASVSLFYTNFLVEKLAEREQEQIDLVAKAQELASQTEDSLSLNFLVNHILEGNISIPMIVADENENPTIWKNISFAPHLSEKEKEAQLRAHLSRMKAAHAPIEVSISEDWKLFVFYENSILLTQLKYFPYVQLSIIAAFFLFMYLTLMYLRKAEQDKLWVGLAKETAHQLGTPLSSLIAWLEYLKVDEQIEGSILEEMEKDVKRLEIVTQRFSNIGSLPDAKVEYLPEVIENIIDYLRKRISSKIKIYIHSTKTESLYAPIGRSLFEWVIENLCKNAVDAIKSGKGEIHIYLDLNKNENFIQIDISDTGKGIPKANLQTVFRAGYTTKKRGWGLGLALAKRIIEEYHHGKIFVQKSEINVGTTFRILLPKAYPAAIPPSE